MSTHCTTAVIARRSDGDETLVSYFRHHDGYPAGNGADLVGLIKEVEPRNPEALIRAIEQRWTKEERRERGPFYERTEFHGQHGDCAFRYDVVFDLRGGRALCQVECLRRVWDGPESFVPEQGSEWEIVSDDLRAAVADWPVLQAPPGPRIRLSALST